MYHRCHNVVFGISTLCVLMSITGCGNQSASAVSYDQLQKNDSDSVFAGTEVDTNSKSTTTTTPESDAATDVNSEQVAGTVDSDIGTPDADATTTDPEETAVALNTANDSSTDNTTNESPSEKDQNSKTETSDTNLPNKPAAPGKSPQLTRRQMLDQMLNGTPAEPREVKLLIPENEFKTEDGALRVSYDDLDLLKVLNMEPVTAKAPDLLPGWLKKLHGQRIRIRGFMYPTFQESDIEYFALARDNDICCFRRDPKIYDVFKVILKDGVTTDYIEGRPFDVVGTFLIAPKSADDELYELYRVTNAEIVQSKR